MEAEHTSRALDGFDVRFSPATGSKEIRAKPVSAQCEAGNIRIVRGPWNDDFIRELENFPAGRHDDGVDGLSGAHQILSASFSGAGSARDIASALAVHPLAPPPALELCPDPDAYTTDLRTY
jgi:hypothetical protein